MSEICPVCGLPKDICICEEMSREQQQIRIRLENRKWSKIWTIIDGIDSKGDQLRKLSTQLKNKLACGGTAKDGQIMLMGDHRDAVKDVLVDLGFPKENIEVQ